MLKAEPVLRDCRGWTLEGPTDRPVTFVKWPAGENVPSVGKARAPGAQGVILLGAGFGALLAVGAPGRPDGTAAGVHAELAGDRMDALIFVPLQVTLLHADVYTERNRSLRGGRNTHCTRARRSLLGAWHGVRPWRYTSGWEAPFLTFWNAFQQTVSKQSKGGFSFSSMQCSSDTFRKERVPCDKAPSYCHLWSFLVLLTSERIKEI